MVYPTSYAVTSVVIIAITVSVNMAEIPPEAAHNVVVTAQGSATAAEAAFLIMSVDPGLKLYQPTQRTNVPSMAKADE